MENEVAAILNKLQELREEDASNNEVYYYANLLCQTLLKNRKQEDKQYSSHKVSVVMPRYMKNQSFEKEETPVQKPQIAEREKEIVEEQIPVGVAALSNDSINDNPQTSLWEENFEEEKKEMQEGEGEHPEELNESRGATEQTPSWNERLKLNHEELGNRLRNAPVKKLSQAIGVNDKFTFINELFREDQALYSRCLKTIDKCKNLDEAMYWINRELKIKLGWQDDDQTVQDFYNLVRKRFS